MKPLHFLTFGIALTAAVTTPWAQTYQWKDGSGRTIISDTPPPGTAKAGRQTILTTTSSAAIEKVQPSPEVQKTIADRELDFKKRQQEAKEKAEKNAKEQTAAAEKQATCERAQQNLSALESGQVLFTPNERGERQAMDNSQREIEIERTRKIMIEACK